MSKNDFYLSLSQAAEATGKSKSVISKYLKNGTLSYAEKDDKGYKIDPAELFRVFPKNDNKNSKKEQERTHENTIENALKIKELELKLESVSKERDFFEGQYKNVVQEKEDWKKQAQTLLLKAPDDSLSEYPEVNSSQSVVFRAILISLLFCFVTAILLYGFVNRDRVIGLTATPTVNTIQPDEISNRRPFLDEQKFTPIPIK